MKKLTSVLMLSTFTLALGLFAVGCSSSKKDEVVTETPAMTEQAPVAQSDSLDLGASSAGRAH